MQNGIKQTGRVILEKIIIRSQEEFDKITEIKADQEVTTECELRLNYKLSVFGKLLLKCKLNCSWNGRYVVAWENSSVVARENSSVVAWENSSVVAWGNSSVVARENSSVEARENSSVVAWGNSIIRAFSSSLKLVLNGFSILSLSSSLNLKFKKSKNVVVQKYSPSPYLDREGVHVSRGYALLFKKVSSDFKTQENQKNETSWPPGKTVTHPYWNPIVEECGEGKFHACSRPYFCDEFREIKGDRYIAIKIKTSDLHEWKNGNYPHKIAFREGKVLYECDKFGKKLILNGGK